MMELKLTQKGKNYLEDHKEIDALHKKFHEIISDLLTDKKELTKAVYDAIAEQHRSKQDGG